MPACFSLLEKGTNNRVDFLEVDEKMCAHFGADVHPERYYKEWYNAEGFGLACGNNWDDLREKLPERKEIIDWLEKNYDYDNWHEMR